MLTYDFYNVEGPIYTYVYNCIKRDILDGVLKPDEKLPSKRTFAKNNGISTITIQNAYDQLISEGYVYTLPKRGYYVSKIESLSKKTVKNDISYDIKVPELAKFEIDLSNNGINPDNFPFSIWAKISREVMQNKREELMRPSPVGGVKELRNAISNHLKSFRGMLVDPNQIVIGAGTEYLYNMLIGLLGVDKNYVIENPGYMKLSRIYSQQGARCSFAPIDSEGITVAGLNSSKANVAHICPNHHYPTGITMPAKRRYEILAWANEEGDRYIIEDDYDSEFRLEGKPIPTLFSIDGLEKVIYMNTFSKSLSPTIRISYMVLPVHLANRFYEMMSFYSCTVSNFEQYTLARFISLGYFEKHINRMRLFYMRHHKRITDLIANSKLKDKAKILESDSGLHFLLKLDTRLKDSEITSELNKKNIKLMALTDYWHGDTKDMHLFIINYSNLKEEDMSKALLELEMLL